MQQYIQNAKSIKRKIKFSFPNPLLKPRIQTSPHTDDLSTQFLSACPLRPRARALHRRTLQKIELTYYSNSVRHSKPTWTTHIQ
ncbi:hypothetical protein Mapa_010189 [Marchantia paleacea]|nr:hypothetical protein Mapa_010189 [Marchantia paleacea]